MSYGNHMAISTSNDLRLRASLLVDVCPLFLPSFAKYLLCKLPGMSNVRRVAFLEHIHDLICNDEGLVLQSSISGDGVN